MTVNEPVKTEIQTKQTRAADTNGDGDAVEVGTSRGALVPIAEAQSSQSPAGKRRLSDTAVQGREARNRSTHGASGAGVGGDNGDAVVKEQSEAGPSSKPSAKARRAARGVEDVDPDGPMIGPIRPVDEDDDMRELQEEYAGKSYLCRPRNRGHTIPFRARRGTRGSCSQMTKS